VKFTVILEAILVGIPLIWFMYTYLDIPTKYFSIALFMLVLCLMCSVFIYNKEKTFSLTFNSLSFDILLCIVFAFSFLSIVLIPSADNTVFLDLASIGFMSWLRIIAGLLLAVFLPGFTIISWFKAQLNRISVLILSFLLSIFISIVTTYVAIVLNQSVMISLLIVNLIIMAVHIGKTIRNSVKGLPLQWFHALSVKIDVKDILLITLCFFQISTSISVFLLSGFTVPDGDMWTDVSMAALAQKGGISRFGSVDYPPFFPFHLLSVNQLSGLPLLNVSALLGLFNVFTLLAFYSLALALTHKKSVAILSAFVFTVFGSFTFLIQAILGEVSTSTGQLLSSFYAISTGKTSTANSLYHMAVPSAYAPGTLTLISILALLALLIQREKPRFLLVLESLLVASLFLLHIAETAYIAIFVLAALLLGFSRVKDLASITLGVWLGEAIYLGMNFTLQTYALYAALIPTLMLISSLLFMNSKLLKRYSNFFIEKCTKFFSKSSVRLIFVLASLLAYAILVLIWKAIYLDNNRYIPEIIGYFGASPTYFMPIVFGIPMLLSVLFCAKCLSSKEFISKDEVKVVAFLVISFFMAFLAGKTITCLNILGYAVYREGRIVYTFGWIIFPIISGYAFYKAFLYIKEKNYLTKRVFAAGLVFLILLGSSTTILSATFWSQEGLGTYSLSSKEIEAMNFLKGRVNSSTIVWAYNAETNTKLGLTGAITGSRYWLPWLSVSPSIPKLWLEDADYIFLTRQDYINIQSSADGYMKSLIDSGSLPVIYNNSEDIIFEVPPILKLSNGNLSVPVITGDDLTGNLPQLITLDNLGLSYRIYDDWDNAALQDNKVAILLKDLDPQSLEGQKYLNWIQNSGHLIVLSSNSSTEEGFSSLMNIRPLTKNVSANGISFEGDIMPINTSINMVSTESSDKDVQVASWYTLNNTMVSPFAYSKKIGNGSLTYVDLAFTAEAIPSSSIFRTIFLKSLDPSLPTYTKSNSTEPISLVIMGNQTLEGNVKIVSGSMLVQGSGGALAYSLRLANGNSLSGSENSLAFNSPVSFTLSVNGNVTMRSLHDEYAEILIPNSTEVTMYFSTGNQNATYTYVSNNETANDYNINYNITAGSIRSDLPMTVIAKMPEVSVEGAVRFESPYFDYPYSNIVKTEWRPLKIYGETSYNILMTDEGGGGIMFGNYFSFNGSIDYGYPTIFDIELPAGSVPLLMSTQNIFILLLIGLLVFLVSILLNFKPSIRFSFRKHRREV